MSRRDDILEELGLTPLWRLRTAADESAALADEAPAAARDARAPAADGEPPPVTRHPSPVTSREAAVTRHSSPVTASGDSTGRREQILRMEWPALKERVASCTDCPLHARRKKTVFGVGDENADWLFVGEGPGADEDAQGEPFVGQAGKLLDNMLAAIKLKRGENVYIGNIVKCRPPGNRNPAPEEASACEPYLARQIDLIRPKLIIALGKVAALNLLAREASIASLRGKVHRYRDIPLIVTYHPAYLLRSMHDKAKAWEDLCFAVRTMADLEKA